MQDGSSTFELTNVDIGNLWNALAVWTILFHSFYLVFEPPLEVEIIAPSIGHEGEVTLTSVKAVPAMTQIQISGASNTMFLQTAFPGPRFLMKKGVPSLLRPQQAPPPWTWAHPPQEQRILLEP